MGKGGGWMSNLKGFAGQGTLGDYRWYYVYNINNFKLKIPAILNFENGRVTKNQSLTCLEISMLIGNNICSCQPSIFWLPKCLPILTSKMFTSLRNKSRKSWISYHNTILSITIQKFILKSKGFHEIYFYTSPPYLPSPPTPHSQKTPLIPV